MKNFKIFLLAAIILFAATLAILEVDRQGALMYGEGGAISGTLEDFTRKIQDQKDFDPAYMII